MLVVFINIIGIGANYAKYANTVENEKEHKMGMSNKEYHLLKRYSHSLIVACRDKGCLAAYKESAFNPEREEEEPNNSLEFGSLYHTLVRSKEIVENPDSYINSMTVCLNPAARTPKDEELKWISIDDHTIVYIYDFGLSRTNKAYSAMKAYLQMNNQWPTDSILCNQEEFDQCIAMIKALYVNPYYQAFFQNYELVGYETDIMFQLDGFDCKARPDVLLKDPQTDNYFIIDWKTTKNLTREQNQVCGQKMGYHIQDYMYRNAVAQKYKVPLSQTAMLFFMQNKEYPEIVYVARFNGDSYRLADSEFCQYARDFDFRLKKYNEGDAQAFIDNPGILEYTYFEPKLLEQPD